ncbi:MAG: prepilin-type N-terminal cleavage/methylation domain-containing protein [Candidatus Omnitrophota bacterium]|nr:prepilin-type N-terminal cleavage/methylation domain-containing protein [Candidatus Omnitrophota bacterium]
MFIKNKRSGFTLVEIMIVVAIIALLAAVGIPSLLNARRAANQASAQANLKTIATEAETFAAQGAGGLYPVDVAATGDADTLGSVTGTRLCGNDISGYTFTCTFAATGYQLLANPVSRPTTGDDGYEVNTGGAIEICTAADCA